MKTTPNYLPHLLALGAIIIAIASSCGKVYAQEATNAAASEPQIAATLSTLEKWGVTGEITSFAYGTYAPSLKHSLGGGVGVIYHSATNSILGTEARIQYLDISKEEGQIWQPNLMETASKRLTFGRFFVEPVLEMGVAMDSRCHPYMITGGALAVGRGNFSVFAGVERWVGPYDSFTCYQGGVAWHF
jgi:hypothetical protein